MGLRQLKVTAQDVTAGSASTYGETVAWAQAAHATGLDSLVWMSRMCDDTKAYVFFGHRCTIPRR